MSNHHLHEFINQFLEHVEIEKNQSKKTIQNYDHYLRRFEKFASQNNCTKPEQITLELVRQYRLYLNRLVSPKGNHLKTQTQTYHVIALRAFLKYLTKRDISTLSPEKIELAKTPARQVGVMRHDELRKILHAITTEKDPSTQLRDYAILLTLFSSGMRISELTSIKRTQINLENHECTVRGKGDKLRLVFLSPEAVKAIKAYLSTRQDNNTSLFISHAKNSGGDIIISSEENHPGLTPRSIQRLVKKYSALAGITHPVTPHTFRHTFATDLLENGADIRSVQSMLGHSSITTTQIYTHVTNQGLKEIHKKFHNTKSE